MVSWLHYLSVYKLFNLFKLRISYVLSRLINRPLMYGLPFAVSIEPTTHCNLRCPQCPSGLRSFSRPTGMLDLNDYQTAIEALKRHLIHVNLYFQGEPFLNKNLISMIAFAHRHNIHTGISTNGHYMTAEMAKDLIASGLDEIIFSVDGLNQESYSTYRIGGTLDTVLRHMRILADEKIKLRSKTPKIIWQTVVFSQNEQAIDQIKNTYTTYGANALQLKTAQLYSLSEDAGRRWLPKNLNWSRYIKTQSGYRLKNPFYNKCWRMWSSCVISWDGRVIPCCFDKDAKFVMGYIQKQAFNRLWNNEVYQAFRYKLLNQRAQIEICKNCTEGSKVWI